MALTIVTYILKTAMMGRKELSIWLRNLKKDHRKEGVEINKINKSTLN